MSKIISYKASISLTLVYNKNRTVTIPNEGITTVIIDYNYTSNNMPIIYITLNIVTTIYNTIIEHRNDGKMILNIKYYDAYMKFPVYIDKLKDQFVYKVPNNYDIRKVLQSGENVDNSYNRITIGLYSDTLFNYNGLDSDGIYTDVDTDQLLALITNGRTFIKDQLDYNTKYDQFIIPYNESRTKAISYLYNENPFYKTDYIYFNDFDKSYLIKSGKRSSSIKDMNTIMLNIDKLNVSSAMYQGIEKASKQNCYIIYMNGTDINIVENDIVEKLNNKVSVISEDFVDDIALSSDTDNQYIEGRTKYVRTFNEESTEVVKNTISSSKVVISLAKSNIDSSLINLDMQYKISYYDENYKKYNGNYRLLSKREILARQGSTFTTTTTMVLTKI